MSLTTNSNKAVAGWILTGLASLFFVVDGVMKLVKPQFVIDATVQLGYPVSTIAGIGVALLACTLLYLIPSTSVTGAIIVTGYLGGAVASNVRAGTGAFNMIFPMVFAALVWAGLWLRDPRIRALDPLTQTRDGR